MGLILSTKFTQPPLPRHLIFGLLNSAPSKYGLRTSFVDASIARVISSEARRVRMAGEVGAEDTAAGRTEEHFKTLQEEKRLQDMYLDGLRQNVEDMETRNREYQEQVQLFPPFMSLFF